MADSDTAPNPADFSVDERPREYRIELRVIGTMEITIEADSPVDAKRQAEELADRIAEGNGGAELDEVDDVAVDRVAKTSPRYRVIRNGTVSQVSHLRPGDTPREPTQDGF